MSAERVANRSNYLHRPEENYKNAMSMDLANKRLLMKKTKITFDQEKLNISAEILRALAHPLRIKILDYIDKNEGINVNVIYKNLQLEQSITSQHLRIMRDAGVVNAQKEGKYMFYSIDYSKVDRAVTAVNRFLDNKIVHA